MDNKLLNKTITISSEETKQTQYGLVKKIKDENNLTYSIFQTKQDGSESEAWKQYKEMSLGDTVQISYVEQVKQTQDGKGYMARIIRNFNKDIGNGSQNYAEHTGATQVATQGSKATSEPYNRSGDVLKDDLIIRQVAFKGVIELMTSQILVEDDVEKGVHKWTDKFSRIIKTKELSNPIKEELPTIQVNEPIPDDDIPFTNEDWKFER